MTNTWKIFAFGTAAIAILAAANKKQCAGGGEPPAHSEQKRKGTYVNAHKVAAPRGIGIIPRSPIPIPKVSGH